MSKQLDLKKPVQTRDGRKVDILCTDFSGKYPVVARVQIAAQGEALAAYMLDGRWSNSLLNSESPEDLVNVPEKLTGFINVYRDRYGRIRIASYTHGSAGAACCSIRRWPGIEPLGVLDLSKIELLQP